ncbi:microbial collagenase [Chitinivorax tropicus]|uniref:microbial collagenase n=1 Tax=Chitinivorax tropicus TaxID=714531 RepID=A0A840MJ10_9PROT|nr:M9 family metallopeptidase [Chitinivorax tropicus]MBB5017179.1 microbial collagenase [Chitinivorax tropicus]
MLDSIARPFASALAVSLALFCGVSSANDALQPPRGATTPSPYTQAIVGTVTAPAPRLDFIDETTSRASQPDHRYPVEADDPLCRRDELAKAQGQALIKSVKGSSINCMNSLFRLAGPDAQVVFGERQMITVASEFLRLAQGYKGNNDSQIHQIAVFLRAGYYTQWYNRGQIGGYSDALRRAMQPALDAFFSNRAARDVSRENGAVLGEVVTLIDSASENARFLPQMLDLLNRFDASYARHGTMQNAINNVFMVLFHGHQHDDFTQLVKHDRRYVDTLYNFYRRNIDLRNTDSAFMLANAVREMSRFMQHSERKPQVQPLLRTVFGDNDMVGAGSDIWLAAASSAEYFDKENCKYYGTCDFRQTLARIALPMAHRCSPTVTIRAQRMTPEQFVSACKQIGARESQFHSSLSGNGDTPQTPPAANDQNKHLEVVVFDDYRQYARYGQAIFGIDTHNGGIYLEGQPANAGNQARFISYAASWLKPGFQIWNLDHGFAHYLNGRFNMEGDFNQVMSLPTAWWVEGFAAYFVRQNDFDEAFAAARRPLPPLSGIFKLSYNPDGANQHEAYLAVRFMFERHRDDVERIIERMRTGDYAGYLDLIEKIGSRYDAEFRHWLTTAHSTAIFADAKAAKPTKNTAPTISPIAAQVILANRTSAPIPFLIGDKETNPAKLKLNVLSNDTNLLPVSGLVVQGNRDQRYLTITPAAGRTGRAMVIVSVTDGVLSSTITLQVTVKQHSDSTNGHCPSNAAELTHGCVRKQLDNQLNPYYFIQVPEDTATLRLSTSGGAGDVDLYLQNASGWPTEQHYLAKSTSAGNNESIEIRQPAPGRYHVMLKARQPFSDVSLSATLEADQGGKPTEEYAESKCPKRRDELSNLCLRTGQSGSMEYYWILMPAGSKRVIVSTSGGVGDVVLYAHSSPWPTETNHLAMSARIGNQETVTLENTGSMEHYLYFTVVGKPTFQGLNLRARILKD